MKTKKITMIDLKNNQFYQMPKFLFLDNDYRKMVNDSKILYSLFLDRTRLSQKNNLVDNEGFVYIKFSNTKIKEIMGIASEKLSKIKKELSNHLLIQEVRKFNQSNWIYVYVSNTTKIDINEFEEEQEESELIPNSGKFENRTIVNSKIELSKVRKSNTNKTDLNKTDLNNIYIVDFFEKIWGLYPLKRGKGSIKDKKKKELYLLGFEKIQLAIERYKKDYELRKLDFNDLSLKNGSTFFNSGYIDYIDDNFEYYKPNKKTNNQPIQATNYAQRKYDAEYLDSLYDNDV